MSWIVNSLIEIFDRTSRPVFFSSNTSQYQIYWNYTSRNETSEAVDWIPVILEEKTDNYVV